jgi:hypothetical protein
MSAAAKLVAGALTGVWLSAGGGAGAGMVPSWVRSVTLSQ